MAITKPRTAPRRPRPARATPALTRQRRRANIRLWYDIASVSLIAIALILLATMLWPAPPGENVFGGAVVNGMRLLVGAGVWAFPCVLFLCGVMLGAGRSRSWDNIGG